MAALTAATMVRDGSVAFSPTALTTTLVTYTFDQPVDDKFFVYMEMTSTTNGQDLIFTVAAGELTSEKGAFRKGIGALTVTLSSTGATTAYRTLVGPLETSRFAQSSGNISIAVTTSGAGVVGFIGVAKMPYVIFSA